MGVSVCPYGSSCPICNPRSVGLYQFDSRPFVSSEQAFDPMANAEAAMRYLHRDGASYTDVARSRSRGWRWWAQAFAWAVVTYGLGYWWWCAGRLSAWRRTR